ncbi:MAG: hypothetical protein DRI34_06140 [Deltaproteobacteria bacterium]|nr:MAG: hypothetical protein DRI34_06140 [Deltaproteobacteria bacterium]
MQVTKEMPQTMRQWMDTAQKRFNEIEGKARDRLAGTYQKMVQAETVKKVEQQVQHLRQLLENNIDTRLTPIRKKVEKFSSEMGSKAFATVGVATKADIKSVTRKINKLRDEIRKLTGRSRSRRRPAQKA